MSQQKLVRIFIHDDTLKAARHEMETFKAIRKGENEGFPDGFSTMMYEKFMSHPHEMEQAFAAMVN